jgi:ADP-heptose:LPS heptosyltransferase
VGYNSYGRGFLFNRGVKNEKEPLPIVDELLNIIKSISLDTKDKILKISPSKEAKETIRKFLRERDVKDEDLLIGIHPGSNYPTQSWLKERFAEVADKVTEKYKARVVLIGGPKDKELIIRITKDMINRPLIFFNRPIRELLALIQLCHLLICNNSGPLHLATALRTPTVSTMGPTIPERWWPYGQGHVVIRRDLSCMPCNDATCKLKTFDCMRLITVEEVLEATEQQIFSTTTTRES